MDNSKFLNRILSIDWFNNCGNPIKQNINYTVIYVFSWDEAKRCYTDPVWEDTTLEASNALSEFLNNKYKSEFANWNKIAREGKAFLENNIVHKIEAFRESNNLDKTFTDCVKWDLLGAIMEASYSKCKNRPEFFLELLKVYESGNFPCGWSGKWPDGKLIIF
ncbi:hypothetical protein [Acetivibrio clariflavus]|uniref:Uncharacterized protein n=1 Tax=Acetivibrio clariflavus (strain DSM 19732 / NBRC 101661 / EBR45) TaxID=720554 RepID=G8LW74_ACECE|nr:hypothetical protein [Acetivibrio clariflavus]AEV69721.1 hypothetical protein Clocl_3205 [Acetivibrio clariflavus DSM 19732]